MPLRSRSTPSWDPVNPLIDRYHLLLFPVTLGTWKRFLPATEHDRQDLRLRDSATYAIGVVKLVYDVVR